MEFGCGERTNVAVDESKLRQILLIHRNLELSCGEQGDIAADKLTLR
jgi:hypothetical protein